MWRAKLSVRHPEPQVVCARQIVDGMEGAKQDPASKTVRSYAADGRCYYSYAQVHTAVSRCVPEVLAFAPDVFVAIGGGGFIPARMLRTEVKKPILAVSLELYDDATKTANATVLRKQWFDETPGTFGALVRGKRVLIIDEVDDTRATLQYAVEELKRTNGPSAIGVLVVHNKLKEKKGVLPDDVTYIAGEHVPNAWNCCAKMGLQLARLSISSRSRPALVVDSLLTYQLTSYLLLWQTPGMQRRTTATSTPMRSWQESAQARRQQSANWKLGRLPTRSLPRTPRARRPAAVWQRMAFDVQGEAVFYFFCPSESVALFTLASRLAPGLISGLMRRGGKAPHTPGDRGGASVGCGGPRAVTSKAVT